MMTTSTGTKKKTTWQRIKSMGPGAIVTAARGRTGDGDHLRPVRLWLWLCAGLGFDLQCDRHGDHAVHDIQNRDCRGDGISRCGT